MLQGANSLLANGKIDCIIFEVGVTTVNHGDQQVAVLDHLGHYGYKIFWFRENRIEPYEHTKPLTRTNLLAIRNGKQVRKEVFGPYEIRIPQLPAVI